MKNLLNGITILDITYYLPGPFASMRLAEMGAHVIKIEPIGGDPAKHASGGVVYQANNIGKEIIELDLKSDNGKAQLTERIKQADVMINSFRTGAMNRLGFGYEAVKALQPSMIYCSLIGYRDNSCLSSSGSHDINYMALSGMLSQMCDQTGQLYLPHNTIADYVGALNITEKVLAGLVYKNQTGKGSEIDIVVTDEMRALQKTHEAYLTKGLSSSGIPSIDGSKICYGLYLSKDQRFIAIGALEPKFWLNFCHFAQRPDWEAIALYATGTEEHQDVSDFFARHTWEEWLEISLETDFCVSPVLTIADFHKHPYWQ